MYEYQSNNIKNMKRRNSQRLTVKISSLISIVILFILILPSAVFNLGSIYDSLTPFNIDYAWLDYHFGIIYLLIFVIGLYESIRQTKFYILGIFFLAFIREFIFFLLSDNNIFSTSRYEMYLTILVGYFLYLILKHYCKDYRQLDRFYGLFLISNMLTIYINVAMGGKGTTSTEEELAHIAGRYHASNLDVVGTGELCLITIIYLFFSQMKNKYRYPLMILSFIGLILSGTRSAIMFILGLGVMIFLKSIFTKMKNHSTKVQMKTFYGIMAVVIIIFGMVFYALINAARLESYFDLSRFSALLSLAAFSSDESVLGRFVSIQYGIDIILNHPFGISGFFTNLQTEMIIRGFPTFPHSTFISSYILFGPIILLIYQKWIKIIIDISNYNNKYYWMILYYIFVTIVTGGPIVNFKVIFNLILLTYLANRSLWYPKMNNIK